MKVLVLFACVLLDGALGLLTDYENPRLMARLVTNAQRDGHRQKKRQVSEECPVQACLDTFYVEKEASSNLVCSRAFKNLETCMNGVFAKKGQCGGSCTESVIRTAFDEKTTFGPVADVPEWCGVQPSDDGCPDYIPECEAKIRQLAFNDIKYDCSARPVVGEVLECLGQAAEDETWTSGSACLQYRWIESYIKDRQANAKIWYAQIDGCPVRELVKACYPDVDIVGACNNKDLFDEKMSSYKACFVARMGLLPQCGPLTDSQVVDYYTEKVSSHAEEKCLSERSYRATMLRCSCSIEHVDIAARSADKKSDLWEGCPNTYTKHGESCYSFHLGMGKVRSDAEADCAAEAEGGHVVDLDTDDERDWITQELQTRLAGELAEKDYFWAGESNGALVQEGGQWETTTGEDGWRIRWVCEVQQVEQEVKRAVLRDLVQLFKKYVQE